MAQLASRTGESLISSTGDDDALDGRVGVERLESRDNLLLHRRVEGVALSRAIDRHKTDGSLVAHEDGLIG